MVRGVKRERFESCNDLPIRALLDRRDFCVYDIPLR